MFLQRLRKGQVPPDGIVRKQGGPYGPNMGKPQETNFDVDGKVETMHNHSPRESDRPTPEELQKRCVELQHIHFCIVMTGGLVT